MSRKLEFSPVRVVATDGVNTELSAHPVSWDKLAFFGDFQL